MPPNTKPISRVVEECAAEIAKATVPFYTVLGGNVCQERSGVLFRVGERHFIVTCAHKMRERYKKDKLPAYLGRMTDQISRPIPLKNCMTVRIEGNCVDLAVIELTKDVVEQLLPTNRFIGITEMDLQTIARPAFYLVWGFPSEDTTIDDTGRGVKTMGLWYVTVLHRGERNPNTEYDPSIHVVLNYGKEAVGQDGKPSSVPYPGGLSGCGIWRLTNDENWENWKPEDVKLAAIQHRYDERRDYVMGSWVRFAMREVWHRYEDLRPAMEIVVPDQR